MNFLGLTIRRTSDVEKDDAALSADVTRRVNAILAEIAEVKIKMTNMENENVLLRRANVAISKVVGVVTRRGLLRVSVLDLRRPQPSIHLVVDHHARTPHLQVLAIYPNDTRGANAVPEDSVEIVGQNGVGGPEL